MSSKVNALNPNHIVPGLPITSDVSGAIRENFSGKWRTAVSAIFATTVFLSANCFWHESETVVNTVPWGKIQKGGPYGQFVISWRSEMGQGGCNYSSLYLPETGQFYYVTARHCMIPPSRLDGENFFEDDVYIAERLSDSRRVVISSDAPRSYLPSKYGANSIKGRKLLVIGGLPDSVNGMTSLWFSISGRAEVFQDWVVVIRMPSQQFLQMGRLQGKLTIDGMSGSPVLDDEGNLFWVLSMTYRGKSDYAIVFPIRRPIKRK